MSKNPGFDKTKQEQPLQTRDSRQMLHDINEKINKRKEMFDANDRSGKKSQIAKETDHLDSSEQKRATAS